MAFQGSLKELPLPDIIQLVSVSGKTGKFSLTDGSSSGDIHLLNGKIVHAVTGKLSGEEAVYEMAVWSEGDFVFVPGDSSPGKTINKSNTNLLMEAARRIDEWKILSKRIPSTHLVPVFTDDATTSSVSLTPQEWRVISKIDERRSIEDLAVALGTSPFEACKLLYGMLTSGLVSLRENFSGIPTTKLKELTPEELRNLVTQLADLAVAEVHESPDAQPEISKAMDLASAEIDSGRPQDAVLNLIRSLEKAVSSVHGPNRAKEFLGKVAGVLH